MLKEKEGRKILRFSSRVALELVNEKTAETALNQNYVRTTKKWRKAIKKKGSYKYAYEGLNWGAVKKGAQAKFSAITGINYKAKDKILKISHLIEGGFRHPNGDRVPGKKFREKAFKAEALQSMKAFRNAFFKSVEYLNKHGRAPNLKTTRSFR